MKKWGLYLSIIVLGILFFVLGLFNRDSVHFDYILGSVDVPLVFIMLICFVCGAFLFLSVFSVKLWYWKGRAKSLEKMLKTEYKEQDKAQTRKEFQQSQQV